MYRKMDSTELLIRGLEKIKLINIYDLVNDEGCFPAALVYYGDNSEINLSSLDVHFELLMERLYFYVNSEDSDEIMMDERTLSLVNSWKSSDCRKSIDRVTEHCLKLSGSNDAFYYEESYLGHRLMPVIKYYLQSLYEFCGKNVSFGGYSCWFNSVKLNVICDDFSFTEAIVLSASDREYIIKIGNFLNKSIDLFINVRYFCDKLEITFKYNDISGCSFFSLDRRRRELYRSDNILQGEELIFVSDETILPDASLWKDIIEPKTLEFLMTDKDNCMAYMLPWGEIILSGVNTVGDEGVRFSTAYINVDSKREMINRYSGMDIINTGTKIRMCATDGCQILYVDKRSNWRLQAGFLSTGSLESGEYKEKLLNRYFIVE